MKTALRILLLAATTSVCILAGDLTITSNASTKGPMGMSSHGIQTVYYGVNFHKEVNDATKIDTLVDYQKGVFYTIKHKDKKIEMISFDDLAAIAESTAKQMEGMPDFMKNMMGGGDVGDVKVEQLGADTIAGRACKKYKLSLGKIVDELSADPTLKIPANPAAYTKFMKLRANALPGSSASSMSKLYEELAKIKGIPLKTHMTGLMGMDVATEATDVKTTDIPASVWALPEGYKMEDQGKKMRKNMK